MKQLAICIPTYNQPEMIREMFIRCLDFYNEFGIDLYIFDSSPDMETETVIGQYKEKYKNIFYKHLSSDIHSNMKVLKAYQEIIGMGEYAYLWLCPDYIQLTREGAICVLDHCSEGFDICVLNYRDVEHLGEKIYTDINTFFLDCAWHMSSYMATIIRISSFANIEWDKFYEKYTTPKRVNHSHVAFYFEQLAKLSQVKAVHIPLSSAHIRISTYRKESFWKKDVFPIWCEYWPDMIDALPDRYQYKKEVVKKLGVNTGILGWENFKALRKEKIYTKEVYQRYKKEWKSLTNVPGGLLWMLAVLPAGTVSLLKRPSLKQMALKSRLRRFCSGNRSIVIYGCGFIAEKTSILLDELHMNYQGYVVSDCSNEKRSFHGRPVIEYGELLKKGLDVGVIMALNKENALQVIKEKQQLQSYKVFYMYKYEEVLK